MIRTDPAEERKQKLRLQRFYMAGLCYLAWIGLGFGMYLAGMLHISRVMVVPVLTGIGLTNVVFFLFIRTGLNQRLRDPSMTFSQIVVAMSWVLVLMSGAMESRGSMLAVYLMCLLFGVFHLTRRNFIVLAGFGLAGYLSIAGLESWFRPEHFDLRAEALRVSVLAGTMLWAALFGSYVSGLRNVLRERNIELKKALEEVHHAARHDHLTQVYNRRYVMQTMTQEKQRADRTRRPFSIVILDLDHFKIINDRYGHLAGDRVLMAFSERSKGTLRGMDYMGADSVRTFGRYGGEEFIVLLPDTELGGAYRCAERLRYVTEDEPYDEVFRVTVSCGVAEYQLGESIEDTLRRADAALYRAKDNGRNCVVADDTAVSGIYRLLDDLPDDKVVVGRFGN